MVATSRSARPARPAAAPRPPARLVRRIRVVHDRLLADQGRPAAKPELAVLDEVVATVLSQHTSDINSERAFASLRRAFPTWKGVLAAPPAAVADAIRSGGIAEVKARRIQAILAEVTRREDRTDLERLRALPDAEVDAYLRSLPGVGPKTAACVLAFAMGRAAFPVDTHVLRVTCRLGWIGPSVDAERAHVELGAAIPPEMRYDLHLALVAHGRTVCTARSPRCASCVLLDVCAHPVSPPDAFRSRSATVR